MNSFALFLFAFALQSPSEDSTPSLREQVDDFPALVARTCEGLNEEPWNRSLRKLWNRLRAEIEYPENITEPRLFLFHWHDLIPGWLWCAALSAASAWLACDLVRKKLGRLRYPLFVPLIFSLLVYGAFILQISRDWAIHSFFSSPLVVLKESTLIRQGNSSLFPVRLPSPLPAGHVLKVAHEAGGWYQVEFAEGEFGWVPKDAAIRVARKRGVWYCAASN